MFFRLSYVAQIQISLNVLVVVEWLLQIWLRVGNLNTNIVVTVHKKGKKTNCRFDGMQTHVIQHPASKSVALHSHQPHQHPHFHFPTCPKTQWLKLNTHQR